MIRSDVPAAARSMALACGGRLKGTAEGLPQRVPDGAADLRLIIDDQDSVGGHQEFSGSDGGFMAAICRHHQQLADDLRFDLRHE